MSTKMSKDYYIGIDMGTDSIGWAVTDTDYHLCKARGRDLWGSYLFEEAKVAAERRMFRATRRRVARVHQRLMLLQGLFADEISKVDPLFFLRLNNSSLFVCDKDGKLNTRDSLFADKDFCDKDYFIKYPTIYHLRAALLRGEMSDLRLLYLGVHHILKNRGHFLFESQSFDVGDTNTVKEKLKAVNVFLIDRDMPSLNLSNCDSALEILKDNYTSKRDKQKKLEEVFGVYKEKSLTAVIKALIGGSVSLKDLYDMEDVGEISSFSFEKSSFDETDFPAIEREIGQEEAELIRLLKAVYDWTMICNIMGEEQYYSCAKIKVYDKHKEDLYRLKEYVRANCPQKYNDVFRRNAKYANYAAYIGMDKQKGFKKCKRDEFYGFLKKEVGVDDETILKDIERGEFLPKQVTSSNGVVPYQLHLRELIAIIEKAKEVFPFLTIEKEGMTVAEKIISLMTFRIPYYVGPLHTNSPFAWATRNEGYENVSVNAWNFSDAINADKSEESFILRMTNKCTYLYGEDVLPANSLLYSEFAFLNELNNLKIDGEKNDIARKKIYEYAKTHKRVTLKSCLKLLKSEGIVSNDRSVEDVFSGTDGDFKKSLAPWIDLKFLGDKLDTHREMCEQIIVWLTLISDKERLEKRIRKEYGSILSDEEIKRLKGINYAKWGRLSAKFLDGIVSEKCTDASGEPMTIIQAMREKGENLMELCSDKYGFKQAVEAFNRENSPSGKITYKTVEELYCSPAVKRGIWRTIELIREIVKIKGCEPKKLFIETTREAGDSKKGRRTISRKQKILDLYKSIKSEERDWVEEIENTPDTKFNSDKLVMYYCQMGRCMYTGKPIRLEDVFNTNICDKDHIYPRSKIKDDSLDNLILVLKTENAQKSDNYPISEAIRHKMAPFWRELRQKDLISERKLERLTRATPLTMDELADFINRQLVITNQSVKATASILKEMLPNTEIVYSKAGNISDFRDKNNIVKVRELNDLHHAKDAYLNIVVGNVYNTKFNHNAKIYFQENSINSYNLKYLFSKDIVGAWKVEEKERILDTVKKNTCTVVRMSTDGKGKLFDIQPVPAGKNDELIPLKENDKISDTKKYGGYDGATTAYFMLVRSKDKKGKTILSIETFPLWLEKRQPTMAKKLEFCTEKLGLNSPEILIEHIKINTLCCIDGSYAWLRGKTGKQLALCNASQLFVEENAAKKLKGISNYMRDRKKYNNTDLSAAEYTTSEDNIFIYDLLIEKLSSPIYAGLSVKGQVPFLQQKRGEFELLSLEQQCQVLFELLHLTQCNSSTSNLSLLGGGANVGKIYLSRFIKEKDFKIIFQSPTGYYRRVVNVKDYL